MLINIDLVIVILVSILMLPVESLASGALKVILGAVFILIVPGYALVSAFFPAQKTINILDRFLLGIGTSIAISTLIGIVLNFTPLGIRLWPIILSTFGFVLVAVIIAAAAVLASLSLEHAKNYQGLQRNLQI